MDSNLLFNFTIDKSTSTVFVEKEFDAGLSMVWDAFTKKEILDQWWAPKPLMSKTIFMDFSVGGRRFYAMVNPEGAEIAWQVFTFTSITPKSNFKCLSYFTDKNEKPVLPGTSWDLTFREQNVRLIREVIQSGDNDPVVEEITKVSISISFDSLEGLEQMIEMGFKEGFTETLHALELLLQLQTNRK